MKSVADYKNEITLALQSQRTTLGQPYLLVKDWSCSYYFGIWDGIGVDAKSLKDVPCENRSLFNQAVEEMLKEGVLIQYDRLTTTWKGTTMNVFLGLAEKEHEYVREVRTGQPIGINVSV